MLAAARTGSATRAAAQLGTTTATVLRRLKALESSIGTRLFDRLPTGLRATPALGLVRPWAEQAEAAATGMLRELSGLESQPVGTVRLAVVPTVATLFVVPAFGVLQTMFPDITLEIVPAVAVVNLTLREADIALRVVKHERGDLVVQRLASFAMCVVRSPKLTIPRGAKLSDLPWLAWDRSLAHLPEAQWLQTHVPKARVVLRSSDLGTLLVAAQKGIGVLAVAGVTAERAGGLVPVDLPYTKGPDGAVWIVAHAALRPVARVAAVWDWLVASISESSVPAESPRRRRAPKGLP